jgi:hypothetical protein
VGVAAVTVPVSWPDGEPRPFALAVPGGVLEIHAHDFCSTRYPGLPPVDAAPHDTDAYRARARSLGYRDDTAAMSREHEAAHHLMARLLGLPYSPTMYGIALHAAAEGPYWPAWRDEECAVLALQRFARSAGVDLAERAFGSDPG